MIKHNKLLLIVCLSVNGSLFSALKPDFNELGIAQLPVASQIQGSIKIEESQKIETTLKTSNAKSIFSKAVLATQSTGAALVSLLCGACFISNTVSGFQYMTADSSQTLSSKLSGIMRCVGGAAGFVLGSYFAYEYSRDSLKALKSGL